MQNEICMPSTTTRDSHCRDTVRCSGRKLTQRKMHKKNTNRMGQRKPKTFRSSKRDLANGDTEKYI